MSQHERTHWLLLFLPGNSGSFARGHSERNRVFCHSVSASVSDLASLGLWFGPTGALRLPEGRVRMCSLGIWETGALFVPGGEYILFSPL